LLFLTLFLFLSQACAEPYQERPWHEAGSLRRRSQDLISS
jgi:hypothetical protein